MCSPAHSAALSIFSCARTVMPPVAAGKKRVLDDAPAWTSAYAGSCTACGFEHGCAACARTASCSVCTEKGRCGSCRNVHSKAHRAAGLHVRVQLHPRVYASVTESKAALDASLKSSPSGWRQPQPPFLLLYLLFLFSTVDASSVALPPPSRLSRSQCAKDVMCRQDRQIGLGTALSFSTRNHAIT